MCWIEKLRQKEMVIRIRYEVRGGHVHCRMFTAKARDLTFAKNGELVFSVEEWASVRAALSSAIEFIPETSARTATNGG